MIRSARNRDSFDDPANQTRGIGEAIYAKMTGTVPTERARQFMGGTTMDNLRDAVRANGVRLRHDNPASIFSAAMNTRASPGLHSTSDFGTVLGSLLGSAMERRLGELFRLAESGASAIVAPGTARDFRPISEVRLTSFPSLEPLNEAGEITWGSLDEEGETLAIGSYARAIGVTFQLLVNDDLGAIDRSIRDIALATALLKAKLIVLAANLADGKALFHADRDNLAGTGAALSDTTLEAGVLAMAKQSAR